MEEEIVFSFLKKNVVKRRYDTGTKLRLHTIRRYYMYISLSTLIIVMLSCMTSIDDCQQPKWRLFSYLVVDDDDDEDVT
jgi:hypothetical protein